MLCACLIIPARAEDKAISILFGPVSPEAREQAAAAATTRIYQWLGAPGTTVELRRVGVRDAQELLKFLKPKDVAQSLTDSARLGGEAPLPKFMDALDIAVYALARKPGLRYLIVALEAPVLNADQISRLKQTADLCKANKVQVLLWDFSKEASDTGGWEALVTGSGGAKARDLAKFEAVLPSATPPPVVTAAGAGKAGAEAAGGLQVRTHLFRSAPPSSRRSGATVGVMSSLFITEIPESGLQFDPEGGNSQAKLRVTQVVKNKAGEAVWQAKKELSVKTPTSKLDARKTGSVVYVRQVRLPASDYTLESTVEDLNAQKTVENKAEATATDMLPGLALSGAMIVRQLNKQIDLFEGDDLIQYDGAALTPMLAPVFPAGEPFTLAVYFLMFPDMNGKMPRMRLDIMQNGQSVGGTNLPFSDKLKDDTKEGSSSMAGEQKHTFPYLAKLGNAMLLAGNYEVKITVQQDTQEVTRTVPFRVVQAAKAK
jgi:hypothetical protein